MSKQNAALPRSELNTLCLQSLPFWLPTDGSKLSKAITFRFYIMLTLILPCIVKVTE